MTLPKDAVSRTMSSHLGEAAYRVVEKLHDAGYTSFWVGGAVRDMALGNVPHEIDIATSAKPENVQAVFPRSDAEHASLGVVVVSELGHTFEVTTFRRDSAESDGRKPANIVFASREEDSKRRDATINAMYFQPISREVLDDFGGLKDVQERLVRFIGDPEVRLREDALRALRMVRLRATIDGQYDPATYTAIRKCTGGVDALSGTRKMEEIDKILACPRPNIALSDLEDLGLLAVTLPEVLACKGVAQPKEYHREGDVFNHLLLCTTKFTEDHSPDVRLATLLHDIGKPSTFVVKERIRFDHHAEASADIASTLLTRLQVPTKRIEKIDWLIRHHMMMASFQNLTEVRKAHWYFHPWFKELLEVFWLDAAGTNPGNYALYDWIIDDYNHFLNDHPRPQKPYMTGEDVMRLLGLRPGAEVGRILQRLHEAQISKEIQSKKEAEAFLRKIAVTNT